MPNYMSIFNNRRRGPKFKPGDIVYDNEKYIVEISYVVCNESGTRYYRKESQIIGVDLTAEYHSTSNLYRRALNSYYGIKISDLMGIKKVIFNAPATIVLWNDGTKTVVKCSENDIFDPEKGLAFCFLKKLLGSGYYKIIDSEVSKYDEQKLADIESESIVGQTLRSIADDIKTGLANLGGGASS